MRDWLQAIRLEKGMTMKELAKRIGISEGYYSLIENGERLRKMDLTFVLRLSTALGIPVQQIVKAECEFERRQP